MPTLGSASFSYKAVGLTKMRKDIKGLSTDVKMGVAAIGASVGVVTAAVLKIGMPFEQMMLNTGAAMRATEDEVARLEIAARKAGKETEHLAEQAGSSLLFMAKAGLDAGESMANLGTMLDFKTAIQNTLSLGKATDVLTDSTTAMGLSFKDMGHVADVFIASTNRSAMDTAQLGEAMSNVAGVARLYGDDIDQVTAALAISASQAIKGGKAGRQLKNVYTNTSKAARELGIANEGMIPTLRAVADAHWDADKIVSIYGKVALPTVAAQLNKISGTEKGSYAYMVNEMRHASDGMGESAVQAEKMRSSVENQFKIVNSLISDIALTIFEDWKPSILEALAVTQQFFKENEKGLVEFGDVLLPVLKGAGFAFKLFAEVGAESFGFINSIFLGFQDLAGRVFIEFQHAGKIAWAQLGMAFGVVMDQMLGSFAAFAGGAAEAFNAIGGYDIAGPLQRASMALKVAAKDTHVLTDAYKEAKAERIKDIAVHDEIIDQMAREHQGYKITASESRKAAESVMADNRAKGASTDIFTKKQIADMQTVADKAALEATALIGAQKSLYKELGVMGDELYASKKSEIDGWVTAMRIAGADEVLIEQGKIKRLDKLNAARLGKTVKQVAGRVKAQKKGIDASLKNFFAGLDKEDKRWTKHNDKMLKDREEMAREMEKLDASQGQEFEKQLEVSQGVYEDFIKETLGIKELSTESQTKIDKQYQEVKDGILSGEIESFNGVMTDILTAKEVNTEKLKENDTAYGIFLAEQEIANKVIRLDFYRTSGVFSQEYYDDEATKINAYSEKLRMAGVDAVAIEQQKTDAIRALDIQKLESSDSFFDGVKLGMLESQQDMTTWADVGKDIFTDFESTLAGAFKELFSGVIRGNMDSLSGAWDGLWRGMLDTVITNLAQMAAEFAAAQIVEAGSAIGGGILDFLVARDGAEVPGGGALPGGPDGIPAVLHPGEWVLPDSVVQKLKSSGIEGIDDLGNYFQPDTYTQSEAYAMYRKSGAMEEDKEILRPMLSGAMSGSEWENLSIRDMWKTIQSQGDKVVEASGSGRELEHEQQIFDRAASTHLYGMMTGSNPEFIVKEFSSPGADSIAASGFVGGGDGGSLDIGSMFSDDPAVREGINASLGSYSATIQDSIKTLAATAVASGGDMSLAINAGIGKLLSPDALTNALVAGADAAVISYFGLDPGSAGYGAKFFGIVGNMMLGPIGGAITHVLGNFAGDAIADGLNLRTDEWSRDIMESEMGYFAGRRDYNATQHMYTDRGAGVGGVSTGGFAASATGGAMGEDRGGFGGVGGGWHDSVGEAEGGVINRVMVPRGEDGLVGIQFGEGVVSRSGMEALGDINLAGKSGGRPARAAGNGRERQLEEMIRLLTEAVSILSRSENVQERMASRGGGDFNGMIDTIGDILSSEATGGTRDFTSPEVMDVVNQVNQGTF